MDCSGAITTADAYQFFEPAHRMLSESAKKRGKREHACLVMVFKRNLNWFYDFRNRLKRAKNPNSPIAKIEVGSGTV